MVKSLGFKISRIILSNGKVERLVQTLKKHKSHFKTWEKWFYNFKRPHMSLYTDHLRTPYQAFLDKMRK